LRAGSRPSARASRRPVLREIEATESRAGPSHGPSCGRVDRYRFVRKRGPTGIHVILRKRTCFGQLEFARDLPREPQRGKLGPRTAGRQNGNPCARRSKWCESPCMRPRGLGSGSERAPAGCGPGFLSRDEELRCRPIADLIDPSSSGGHKSRRRRRLDYERAKSPTLGRSVRLGEFDRRGL
jgi:hypothetical protein